MKKLLYVLVAIVGLVLIVPSFVDWSHFKAPLVETIKTNTGYDLDIKGSINLSFLPTPHLKAQDIFVKNKPGGKSASLFELKSISLSLNIIPLLQGKIEVDKVELIEPIIHLETSETGQNNWDTYDGRAHTLSSSENPIIKQEQVTHSQTPNLSLRKVIIKDGQISFVNFKTKAQYEIKNINLEGSFDSLSGPFKAKGQADVNEFRVKGDIQTGELFQKEPAAIKADISLFKDKENYGTFQINGNLQDKRFVCDVHSHALKLPFSLDLPNKQIDLRTGLTLQAHIDAEPENIKVSALKANIGDIKLEGDAAYKTPSITGKVFLSEDSAQIGLLVQGKSDDKSLWNGQITIHSEKPQPFLKWAGMDANAPYLQGGMDISTTLNAQESIYMLSGLKFKVGQFDGAGEIKVKLGETRPYVGGELTFGKLDFNVILGGEKAEKGNPVPSADKISTQPKKPEGARLSKEKWNLEFLKILNTDFKINIRELHYDEYQLSQVNATLHLKDGDLQVTSFGAQGYGGSLSGDMAFQQATALKLNFGVQKLDMSALPKVRHTPLKRAILSTSLHLNAKGDNTYDAIHSLGGEMHFNLNKGIVEAFDIKKFVSDIKHVKRLGDVGAIIKDLNSKAQIPFDYLKANFTVQKGKASSQDIEFSSSEVKLAGKGTIDLSEWFIRMQTQIKIKELPKLPPLRLVIEGSLDSPSYSIDHGQLAKILLQEVAGRVVDKAVQGIGDKVGDVLKESPLKPEKLIKDLLKAFQNVQQKS